MFLEIMTENNDGDVPSTADLTEWATTYGLTMPVLADSEGVMWQFATSGSVGYPYTILLDRGVVVESVGTANVGEMDDLLDGSDTGG